MEDAVASACKLRNLNTHESTLLESRNASINYSRALAKGPAYAEHESCPGKPTDPGTVMRALENDMEQANGAARFTEKRRTCAVVQQLIHLVSG